MEKTVQVTTRVSGQLAADLLAVAQMERRSLSNLLVLAIEKFVAEHKEAEQKKVA